MALALGMARIVNAAALSADPNTHKVLNGTAIAWRIGRSASIAASHSQERQNVKSKATL
jgi:hypothetical protein